MALYWRQEYLADDVGWLAAQNYDVYEFDCERWRSEDAGAPILRVVGGHNINALDNCLTDLPVRDDGGAVLIFNSGQQKLVTVKNISPTATVHFAAPAAVTGTNARDFALSMNTCTSSLAPGSNCMITVSYNRTGTTWKSDAHD